MHPFLVLALTVAAGWDGWRWYADRVSASPEESLSLVMTLAFVAVLGIGRLTGRASLAPVPLWPLTLLLLAYTVSQTFAPPIFRAALAVAAATYCLYRVLVCERPPVAFWGLVALAMPVVPSLQFVLGYPMRLVSAAMTVGLLELHGLAIERQGTFLLWHDEMVQFDAPCSGVNMLWAGLMLTFMGAVLFRLPLLKVTAALAVSVCVTILANVLRASSLFYLEAGLFGPAAGWWHEGAGLAAFALSVPAMLWILVRLRDWEAPEWAS